MDLDKIKENLKVKNRTVLNLKKEIQRLRNEIKNEQNQLYQLCDHKFETKTDDGGCYSTRYYKCVYCGKNK
jgi:hypothetical protein